MPNTNPVVLEATDGASANQRLSTVQDINSLWSLLVSLQVHNGAGWIPLTTTLFAGGSYSVTASDQEASVTTTEAQMGAAACDAVLLEAPSSNTDAVVWGFTTAKIYFELWPGDSRLVPVANKSQIYRKAASGTQKLSWATLKAA